jgi:hypothetical protein
MNYIHEAVAKTARRAGAMAERPVSWRAAAVVTRPRPTLVKISASPSTALMLAVVLLLLSPIIAWLYESWGIGPDPKTTQIIAPNPLAAGAARVESLKSGQTVTIRAGTPPSQSGGASHANPPSQASERDPLK